MIVLGGFDNRDGKSKLTLVADSMLLLDSSESLDSLVDSLDSSESLSSSEGGLLRKTFLAYFSP